MLLRNYHKPTIHSRQTTISMPLFSTIICRINNTLFSQTLSLTHSHSHNNQSTTTISPLNTFSLRPLTFDCQRATKFSTKCLIFPSFPLCSIRSFASKPHHSTRLKRFRCGYEAHHSSTTKVQSPQFSHQFFPLNCNAAEHFLSLRRR